MGGRGERTSDEGTHAHPVDRGDPGVRGEGATARRTAHEALIEEAETSADDGPDDNSHDHTHTLRPAQAAVGPAAGAD